MPLPIDDGHVAHARGQQQLGDGDTGRTGSEHHHPQVAKRRVGQPGGVHQRREHHDRRAVLVVVEDRDVERLLQPALDLEATRCADVFEVDAAEPGRDGDDGRDDLVDVAACPAGSAPRRRRRSS